MQEFTKIKSDLLTGITTVSQDRINGKKNTGLYDAIGYSINRLTEFRNNSPESIPEKSVLIVITDGLDNASVVYTSTDEIVLEATASGIQIITIGIGRDVDSHSLFDLATRTGGLYFFAPTPDDLLTIFTRFLDNLNNQYIIKYDTDRPGSPNMVTVNVITPVGFASDALGYACP